MMCNAHIDPIWQWDWPEGVSATLSTFYSAAKLCDEFDYIFCHNEVTVYKYVEKYAPELFAKIKELVKAGKCLLMCLSVEMLYLCQPLKKHMVRTPSFLDYLIIQTML